MLGCDVEEDKLHVMTLINFSKRRIGQNLLQEQVRRQRPNPLMLRELLSKALGVFDPVGLMTPAKQKEAILVWRVFWEVKDGRVPINETWDTALSEVLREDAIKLF